MDLADSTVVSHLTRPEQLAMLEAVRSICKAAPLLRLTTRSGAALSVRVTNAGPLGWISDAKGYRYVDAHPSTGHPWPPIPAAWVDLANRFAGADHPWDAAVINWYAPDASLGEHQDVSERDCSPPVVTFSLGDAASWTVRRSEHGHRSRCRLEPGAVTVLAGANRLAMHAIERIIAAPLLSVLGSTRGRVSVSMRVAG